MTQSFKSRVISKKYLYPYLVAKNCILRHSHLVYTLTEIFSKKKGKETTVEGQKSRRLPAPAPNE